MIRTSNEEEMELRMHAAADADYAIARTAD